MGEQFSQFRVISGGQQDQAVQNAAHGGAPGRPCVALARPAALRVTYACPCLPVPLIYKGYLQGRACIGTGWATASIVRSRFELQSVTISARVTKQRLTAARARPPVSEGGSFMVNFISLVAVILSEKPWRAAPKCWALFSLGNLVRYIFVVSLSLLPLSSIELFRLEEIFQKK